MRRPTKRLILATVGTLAILALLVSYTWPVLGYALFIEPKVPQITPRHVATLPEAPAEWEVIDIAGLKLSLPIYKCKLVSGSEDVPLIGFSFESHRVIITDLAATEELAAVYKEKGISLPLLPYQQALGIANSSPSDISIFNTRGKNQEAVCNLVLKGMMGENAYEIDVVDQPRLKAICWKMLTKGAYHASATIYNQSENNSLHIMVNGCGSKRELDAVLAKTLGGMRLPEEKLDLGAVREDIRKIIDTYQRQGP